MKLTDHFNPRKAERKKLQKARHQSDPWKTLDRFLILGTEGGTFHLCERALTITQAKNVLKCIKSDGLRVVKRIVEISQEGRAHKNDYALFALAMCAGMGNEKTRKEALVQLPNVARIGTHLFLFAEYIEAFRGWGRGLKNAIGKWYTEKENDKLLYQLLKYQKRGGWSHRDLLRLCHAKAKSEEQKVLFDWACSNGNRQRQVKAMEHFELLHARDQLINGVSEEEAYKLVIKHRLTREAIPTTYLNSSKIWEALLIDMPLTALIRSLGKLTQVGLITDFSDGENLVLEKLTNLEMLKRARIHPLAILNALLTYKMGCGLKGNLVWSPTARVMEALEHAFYSSFANVEPTHKRILIAVDVSSSMFWGKIAGTSMKPGEAAAALSLVTKETESQCLVKAFSHHFLDFSIPKRTPIDQIIWQMNRMGFGATDCSLPMQFAKEKKIPVDAFIILTDSHITSGWQKPPDALKDYRDASGIDAKMIVCAMVANHITVADPLDRGMLDVVGFDTHTPEIMANFIRGQI